MNDLYAQSKNTRKSDYRISDFILGRWSPRSMTGEPLTDDELLPLFEAARWAPSSYNNQPWRFVYAKRDTPHWDSFLGLLGEFNQMWCKNAAVLVVIISRETFEHNGKPTQTHSFDTGSAWMSLALQGASQGLVVHGMEGFDYEKAKSALKIPDGFTVEAMCAIGKLGKKEDLPADLQSKETPSDRRPLREIAMEGTFTA